MDAPVNDPGVHVYEEKPLAVNVAFEPGQIELEEPVTPKIGFVIIMIRVFVLLHPNAFVPVTVYVILLTGETTTEFPIKPPGFHV